MDSALLSLVRKVKHCLGRPDLDLDLDLLIEEFENIRVDGIMEQLIKWFDKLDK